MINNDYIRALTGPLLQISGTEQTRYPILNIGDGLSLVDDPTNSRHTLSVTNAQFISASYLTLNSNTNIPNQRTLAPGANITFSDDGAGSTLTINSLFVGSSSLGVLASALPTLVGGTHLEIKACAGYSGSFDGAEGIFVWLSGSSISSDDGIVFGNTNSGRWKRLYSGPIHSKWFGCKADGTTNDSSALQRAFSTAASGTLYLDAGTHLLNSGVTSSYDIILDGPGKIKRGSLLNGPMISITGTSNSYLNKVNIYNLSFDGAGTGSLVYNSASLNDDLVISYASGVYLENLNFYNTTLRSCVANNCLSVTHNNIKYFEGATSSGNATSTTVFHSYFNSCSNVTVDGSEFKTSITYNPGDKTQSGVTTAAPTSIFMNNCDHITIDGIKSKNAGNIEIYEANKSVNINACEFIDNHLPAIKLDNYLNASVVGNIVKNPQHYWGSSIHAGAYTRLTSYGCLRSKQGNITIVGNNISGSKSDEGPIIAEGALFNTGNLDTRISSQGSYGYTTVNVVTKSAGNYYYVDFDGTTSPVINQKYLTSKNVIIEGNIIDGYSTTGIYGLYCDTVKINDNTIINCADQDTSTGFNKTPIKTLDCYSADINDNTFTMPSGSIPRINTTASYTNGIMAQTSDPAFVRNMRVNINDNKFNLNQVGNLIYVQDLDYVSIQNNTLGVQSFLNTNSSFIRADGCTNYGIIGMNKYSLDDITVSASAGSSYTFIQSGFMSLRFEDDLQNKEITKRVVNNAADLTNPNQVASGYYTLGSTVTVTGNKNASVYRCSTEGYVAPTYSAGTTYSAGNKVNSSGEFFVALQTTVGNTPTPTTGDSNWRRLGTLSGSFTLITY